MRKTNRLSDKPKLNATAIWVAIIKLVQEIVIALIENKQQKAPRSRPPGGFFFLGSLGENSYAKDKSFSYLQYSTKIKKVNIQILA